MNEELDARAADNRWWPFVLKMVGLAIFFTVGWPFAAFYVLLARLIGFSDERRQKAETNAAIHRCPACGRTVSLSARVCPACEHRFAARPQ